MRCNPLWLDAARRGGIAGGLVQHSTHLAPPGIRPLGDCDGARARPPFASAQLKLTVTKLGDRLQRPLRIPKSTDPATSANGRQMLGGPAVAAASAPAPPDDLRRRGGDEARGHWRGRFDRPMQSALSGKCTKIGVSSLASRGTRVKLRSGSLVATKIGGNDVR